MDAEPIDPNGEMPAGPPAEPPTLGLGSPPPQHAIPIKDLSRPQFDGREQDLYQGQFPSSTPRPFWRRVGVPVGLFLLTCLSMYLVSGPVYMLAAMAILLTHEMGHYLQAVRYRVPASLPIFLPLPLPPLGTMGAVIRMSGSTADRRQIFDIGLTGPLAGLAVAIPLVIYATAVAKPFPADDLQGPFIEFQDPVIIKLLIAWFHPDWGPNVTALGDSIYLAAWFGLVITGLNMLPIGQLDGGHVAYALLGKKAHWLARGLVLAGVLYVIYARQYQWIIMLLMLILVVKTDHPRTADDRVPLGLWRQILGWLSLTIPLWCLVPEPMRVVGN